LTHSRFTSLCPYSIMPILFPTLFVAGLIALTNGLHMSAQQLRDYSLEDFVRAYPRNYTKGTAEWTYRERVFETNIQTIMLKQQHAKSWTPGVTRFMDYDDREFSRLLGYKGRRSRGQLGPFPSDMTKQGGIDLPPFVDVVANRPLASRVWDQGQCGSCWAAGAVSVLEGVVETVAPDLLKYLAQSPLTQSFLGMPSPQGGLSMQQITSCTPNTRNCGGTGGCDGATAELAFDMVKTHGLVAAATWPYTAGISGVAGGCSQNFLASPVIPKVGISGYKVLESNKYMPLKQALYQQGHPIAVAVDASSWNFYSGGIYSDTDGGGPGEFTVNHEVTLVGYQDRGAEGYAGAQSVGPTAFWRIKNSWGQHWGENGFIRLEMKDNEGEHCGWDNDAHIGLACDGDPDRVWVCGTCGILFDGVYPEGPHLMR